MLIGLPRSRQSGQAILLILLLTVAAALIGLSLANTGIIASEKMQLQNAADATAFAVSTIEARDLNFSAYTNRAMIANEVATAQMVGIMSHASMITSIPAWIDVYLMPITTTLNAFFGAGTILRGIIQAAAAGGATVKRTVARVTSAITPVFGQINKIYSASQRVMHFGSLYFTVMSIWEIPGKNIDDAEYSLFGYLSLFRHLSTHYPDLRILSPGKETFITSYRENKKNLIPYTPLADKDPKKAAQLRGMERLAAMVNASRDPYSMNRKCTSWGPLCDDEFGGWAIPLFPPIDLKISIDVPSPVPGVDIANMGISFKFNLDLNRKGGTDLRWIKPGKPGPKKEQHYIWTAADQAGMSMRMGVGLYARVLGITFVDESFNFTVSAPGGVGGAQAASTQDQVNPLIDTTDLKRKRFMLLAEPGGGKADKYIRKKMGQTGKLKLGDVQPDFYGQNPGILPTAWLMNGSPVPVPGPPLGQANALAPDWAIAENNMATSYPGLPRYNDSKRGPDTIKLDDPGTYSWGLASPYFLVALEKDMDEIYQGNSRGRFALDPNAAADKISVIGKSEVFFSRPNDLSYYARADGKTELANAFNPYWDARLVDTSYIDRTLALALGQQQMWLPADVTAALTALQNMLNSIKRALTF